MINLNKILKKEFTDYCKLNEIEDMEDFVVKCSKDGLTLDKYGVSPFLPKSQIQEVPVEKEIIKEVIKEIPVEKEVIIEKIVTKEIDNVELFKVIILSISNLDHSHTIDNVSLSLALVINDVNHSHEIDNVKLFQKFTGMGLFVLKGVKPKFVGKVLNINKNKKKV